MPHSEIEKVEQPAFIGIGQHAERQVGQQATESDGKQEQGFELFPNGEINKNQSNEDHHSLAGFDSDKPGGVKNFSDGVLKAKIHYEI